MVCLPDTDLRYFPRRLVPFAIEAGWELHSLADRNDWAVLMQVGERDIRPVEYEPAKKRIAYAGAE